MRGYRGNASIPTSHLKELCPSQPGGRERGFKIWERGKKTSFLKDCTSLWGNERGGVVPLLGERRSLRTPFQDLEVLFGMAMSSETHTHTPPGLVGHLL